MLNAIVLDDERLAVEALSEALNENPSIDVMEKFLSVDAALKYLEENEVDLVFSDIEMPEMDGISFGKIIKEKFPRVLLIYVTAYSEYALEAYNLYAFGYLLKPVMSDQIAELIDKLILLPRFGEESKLKIRTLNQQTFEKDGKPLKFRTTKTLELFCFLIHKNGHWVSSDELLDVIWTNRHEASRKQLHTTFYHLRKALSEVECNLVLETQQKKHRFNMTYIEWDYTDYIKQIKEYTSRYMTRLEYLELLKLGTCFYFEYEWAADTFYYINALVSEMLFYQRGNELLSQEEIEKIKVL